MHGVSQCTGVGGVPFSPPPRCLEKFRQVQGLLAAHGVTRHYRNYPDLDFADPLASYYGDRLARLQKVKQRLDPDQVFRHPQSL